MVARLRAHPLAAILLLAAALRVAVTWGASAHHPDEIFQYLEQAHRLVFGTGYVPWEYRDGMRSWLVPLALAVPMRIGDMLAPEGDLYLKLPRLVVAMATLGTVWAAWRLGAAVSRAHAIVAALVAATWFDQVYFASHTLTETMATAAALPGLALLATGAGRRATAGAGALLALAALLRFHYAPALAVAVLWHCRLDLRRWAALLAGAAPVLAASAAVDLAMGQAPFGWIVANVRRNLIDGAAETFGVSGPLQYLRDTGDWWRWAFAPIVFLGLFGAQRYPALVAVALVTVAVHSAIGHKELRFVLLAMTLLVVVGAIAGVDLARHLRRRWAVPAAAGAWIVASLILSLTGFMRLQWSVEAPALSAAARAGRDGACGLAGYGLRFWQTGGYTFFHRDAPIYALSARDEIGVPPIDRATLARIAPGFDTIATTPGGIADLPPGYARVTCRVPPALFSTPRERQERAICLYRRPGGCDPGIADAWRLR